jgi:hypothetical protein
VNGKCHVCGKRVSDQDAETVPYSGWMCAPCFEEYDDEFDDGFGSHDYYLEEDGYEDEDMEDDE